jgi:hypothetical protein
MMFQQQAELLLQEAKSMHRIAIKNKIGGKKLENDKRLSFITFAIEKYFMVLLMKKNYLPAQHKLIDLLNNYIDLYKVECKEELIEGIQKIDDLDNICSTEVYEKKEINDQEMSDMLKIVNQVSILLL